MLHDPKWDKPSTTPVQEALLQAADYIERHGWCRYSMSQDDGRVCVYGALIHGVSDALPGMEARRLLLKYLKVGSIMLWNDDYCIDQAHAVSILRGAAHWNG